MKSLLLLTVTLYALAIWAFVTQVALPLRYGHPMFPLFRRRVREIEEEIADLREQEDIAHKSKIAERIKSSIASLN